MKNAISWTEAGSNAHRFDAFHDTLQPSLAKQREKERKKEIEDDDALDYPDDDEDDDD